MLEKKKKKKLAELDGITALDVVHKDGRIYCTSKMNVGTFSL